MIAKNFQNEDFIFFVCLFSRYFFFLGMIYFSTNCTRTISQLFQSIYFIDKEIMLYPKLYINYIVLPVHSLTAWTLCVCVQIHYINHDSIEIMYKCMYYVSHGRYMYITELVKFEDMNYYSHVVYVLIFHCKYYLFMNCKFVPPWHLSYIHFAYISIVIETVLNIIYKKKTNLLQFQSNLIIEEI